MEELIEDRKNTSHSHTESKKKKRSADVIFCKKGGRNLRMFALKISTFFLQLISEEVKDYGLCR